MRLAITHLNTQTNSNVSFSLITIEKLVSWGSENKLTHLAISDYYPFEVKEFFRLCQEKAIKPIWGIKFFGKLLNKISGFSWGDIFSVTVFPFNNTGYKDCLRILFSYDSPSNRLFCIDDVFPTLNKNCFLVFESQKIEQIKCFFSWFSSFPFFQKINSDNVFLGFNFFLLEPYINLPENILSKLLPFFSVKYFELSDEKTLSYFKKTCFAKKFFSEDKSESIPYLNKKDFFSFCTNNISFFETLLSRWDLFISKIDFKLVDFFKEKKSIIKKDSFLKLEKKCNNKLKLIEVSKDELIKYESVLKKEVSVINSLGFCDFFLLVSEIVEDLRKKDIIIGFGRGSSASSLVSFLLGITKIDPIKHNLFFERFLNKYRNKLPDIDIDVDDAESVFNYLFNGEKYSKKQICRMLLTKKIGLKQALSEMSKVLDLADEQLKVFFLILEKKPDEVKSKYFLFWRNRFPLLFNLAEKISELNYSFFLHLSGVIISESTSLVGIVPLVCFDGKSSSFFNEKELNLLGFKKYDFLSLKESLGLIKTAKKELNIEPIECSNLDLEDKKTWDFLNKVLLTGVFQLDTEFSRSIFFKIRPKSFFDLVIFLSINRPGGLSKIDQFIRFRQFKPNIIFNPIIREILEETNFCIIFEEQVSQIFSFVYSCSLEEAELKRKDFFKKDFSNLDKEIKNEFLESSLNVNIMAKEANFIFDQIVKTEGFIFNKAHSISYAYLTYYCSYLKANYFNKLIGFWLNEKHSDKLNFFIQEAAFVGFDIMLPDINCSDLLWVCEEKKIIVGFSALKIYFESFFFSIIEERKKQEFKSFEDFLQRTYFWWGPVKPKVLEYWINAGLFRNFVEPQSFLLSNVHNILLYVSLKKKFLDSDKSDLPPPSFVFDTKIETAFCLDEINKQEKECFGFFISFFHRWKIVRASEEIISLTDFFFEVDKYFVDFVSLVSGVMIDIYVLILEIIKIDVFDMYCLLVQDIGGRFKIWCVKSLFEKNSLEIKENNELFLSVIIFKEKSKNETESIFFKEIKVINFSYLMKDLLY